MSRRVDHIQKTIKYSTEANHNQVRSPQNAIKANILSKPQYDPQVIMKNNFVSKKEFPNESKQKFSKFEAQKIQKSQNENGIQVQNQGSYSPFVIQPYANELGFIRALTSPVQEAFDNQLIDIQNNELQGISKNRKYITQFKQSQVKNQNRQKKECFFDDSNTDGFQYLKQDSNIFKRSDNLSHPETNQEYAESIQSRATISQVQNNDNRRQTQKIEDFKKIQFFMQTKLPFESLNKLLFSLLQQLELVKYILKQPSQNQTEFGKCQEASQKVLETIIKHFNQFHNSVATTQQRIQIYPIDLKDLEHMFYMLNNFSMIFLEKGEIESSTQFIQVAIQMNMHYNEIKSNKVMQQTLYQNLSAYHLKSGQTQENISQSLKYIEGALTVIKMMGDEINQTDIQNNQQLKQIQQQKIQNQTNYAISLNNKAVIELRNQNYEVSKQLSMTSVQIMEQRVFGMINSGLIMQVQQNAPQELELTQNEILFNESLNILLISYFNLAMSTQDHAQRIDIFQIGMQFCHQYVRNYKKSQIFMKIEKNYYKSSYYEAVRVQEMQIVLQRQQDFKNEMVEEILPEIIPIDFIEKKDDQSVEIQNELFLKNEVHLSRPQHAQNQKNSFTILNSSRSKNSNINRDQTRVVLLRNQDSYASLPQEQQKRHTQTYINQNLFEERDYMNHNQQNDRKGVPFQPIMSELTKPVKRVSKYDKFDTGMLMRNSQQIDNKKLKLEQQQMMSMNIDPIQKQDQTLSNDYQNMIKITNLNSETAENIYLEPKMEKLVSINKSLNDRDSVEMNIQEKVESKKQNISNDEKQNNQGTTNLNLLSIEANETPLFFKNTGKFQTNHSRETNELSNKSKPVNNNYMNFTLNKNQNEKDNLQQKLEEKNKQEIEKKLREENEQQKMIEFEKFKQEEQRKLEAERIRIQELEKQQREQLEILKQIELEKIRKEELERKQREEIQKQKEEQERQRKEELERQLMQEIEKQKQEQIEKQKMEELERKKKEELEMKAKEELEKQKMEEMKKEMEQLRLKLEEQMKFNSAQQELMKTVIGSLQQNNVKENQVSFKEKSIQILNEGISQKKVQEIPQADSFQKLDFSLKEDSNIIKMVKLQNKVNSQKISDTDNKNEEQHQKIDLQGAQNQQQKKEEKNQKYLDELQKEQKTNPAIETKQLGVKTVSGDNQLQQQFLLKNDKVVNQLSILESQSSESLASKPDLKDYKDMFEEIPEVSAEHISDINRLSEIVQTTNQKNIHKKIKQNINKNTQMDLWITDKSKISFKNKINEANNIQTPVDSLNQIDLNQQIQDIAMRFERSPRNFLSNSRANVQEQIRQIQASLKERKEFHGYQLEQPNYEQILNLIMSSQNSLKLENIDLFGNRSISQTLIQKQYDMLLFNLSQNQVNTLIFVREYQYLFDKKKLWLKNQQLLNDIILKKKIICKKVFEVNPKIFSNEQKKSFQKDIFQSLMFKVYIEAEYKSDQNLDQVLLLMQENPDNEMMELLKIHILSNIKVRIGSYVSNQQKSILENITLDEQEISLLELQTILCMIEDESVIDPWNDKFLCGNQPFYHIDSFDMLCQFVLFPYVKICQVDDGERFQFIVDFNERPIGVFHDHLPIKFLMNQEQQEKSSKNNIKQVNLNIPYVNAFFSHQQNGNSNEENVIESQFLSDQLKLLPGHNGLNSDINFYQINNLNYKLVITPLLDLQTMLFIKLINNQTHVETNNEEYENQNKAQEILNCMETMMKMNIRCVGQLQIDVNFRNKYISDKMFKKINCQDIKFFNESSYASQQNVFEFNSTVQEKNSQLFYQKHFKKFLDALEVYLLAEYKDWYEDLMKNKQNQNLIPKDEIYKELLINIGDQQFQSKFNLEEHQRLISIIIHLKVVHVQIDFQDVLQSPQNGFQAEMHLVHRIHTESQDQLDLKLTSFYTEGPNGEIKTCQSIKFGSKQLKQMFGQRCKSQECLYENYLLNQLCMLKLKSIKIQFQFLDLSKSSISISKSEKSGSNSESECNSVSDIASSKASKKKDDFNLVQLKEFQIENSTWMRQIKIVKLQNQHLSISVPVTFSTLICKNLKIIIGVKIVLFDIYSSCEERGLFLIANQDLWPRVKNQPPIVQNDFTTNYSLNYLMSEVGYDYLIDNFIQFYKINDSKNTRDSDDDIGKIHQISLRIKEKMIYGSEDDRPLNPNKLEDPNFLNIDKDSISQNDDELTNDKYKYEISAQTYREEDSCTLTQLDKYVNVKQLTELLSQKQRI